MSASFCLEIYSTRDRSQLKTSWKDPWSSQIIYTVNFFSSDYRIHDIVNLKITAKIPTRQKSSTKVRINLDVVSILLLLLLFFPLWELKFNCCHPLFFFLGPLSALPVVSGDRSVEGKKFEFLHKCGEVDIYQNILGVRLFAL